MNLIIVTCPQLVSERLPSQIVQMNGAMTAGLISSIHIICMNDIKARSLVKVEYKYNNWSTDIAAGWETFKQNIIAQLKTTDACVNDYRYVLSADYCFPGRELTQSEHSVALRHIIAIEIIASSNSPCLVLEDDALVDDDKLLYCLLHNLSQHCKNRVFYDLSDGYIPIDMASSKLCRVDRLEYAVRPIAVTRTLMAYAMSPPTAKLLMNSLVHYSLPIDMQLQSLLYQLCLPGMSLINTPFRHGSKAGFLTSSVQQS